jgi:hypothetical protein
MEIKHADDWKLQYEKLEDAGEDCDLRDLIADVQQNVHDYYKATKPMPTSKRTKACVKGCRGVLHPETTIPDLICAAYAAQATLGDLVRADNCSEQESAAYHDLKATLKNIK